MASIPPGSEWVVIARAGIWLRWFVFYPAIVAGQGDLAGFHDRELSEREETAADHKPADATSGFVVERTEGYRRSLDEFRA